MCRKMKYNAVRFKFFENVLISQHGNEVVQYCVWGGGEIPVSLSYGCVV